MWTFLFIDRSEGLLFFFASSQKVVVAVSVVVCLLTVVDELFGEVLAGFLVVVLLEISVLLGVS